ncbi:DHHC zinc finger membrane protein [Dissophora ornata]|nr:DHHC zinc finger membrane protein [Dissophora ornata]
MGANESVYSSGAGVGGADNYNHQDQQQQYDNKHNEQLADGTGNNQYDQYGQTAPPPQPPLIVDSNGEPIPKALLDPKVQRQLNKRKVWRPWFVWIVSAIQVAVLVFEFVKGYQRTGQIIETSPFNPMIGPGTGTIIAVGARFVPCMRSTYLDNLSIECPDNTTQICTLSEVCSFTPVITTGVAPDQWLRFITPIFLHGGIIHLLFNLLFQLRTGADLERDMGWWRFSIIYMISGVAGFILGGNFAPILSPSMGASGAIFGLIGCLVLDLLQNWKLVVRPCWELTKLSIMVLVSFAFGLLPYLDNFAHIGGFLAGILSGLVFMPVVYFSKRDKYIKLGLRVIALPLIVLFFVLGLNSFYKGVNNCSWCKYLSCLPINGWCDAFNNTNGTTSSGN